MCYFCYLSKKDEFVLINVNFEGQSQYVGLNGDTCRYTISVFAVVRRGGKDGVLA